MRRYHKTAFEFLKKTMKRHGPPKVIVTDRLRSYRAAMTLIENQAAQDVGR
jgi:putative transposase